MINLVASGLFINIIADDETALIKTEWFIGLKIWIIRL